MKSIYHVIKRPIITEKSTQMHEIDNQVVFEVDRKANKHEVREAIEKRKEQSAKETLHRSLVDALIDLLDLEPIEVNIFRGVNPDEDRQRIFGGQVAGQALVLKQASKA